LLGLPVKWVGVHEITQHITPNTALVIIETPANPTLDIVDIRNVVAAAGQVPVLVDSTFATPILQNPIALGARYVLHSATKFIGGHGDVIAGVVACSEADAKALRQVRVATGALLHPLAAYLLHRGLPTLKLRVETAQANAQHLAHWLETQSAVKSVYYPGLHTPLPAQMRGGGCVLAFEMRGGYHAAATVMKSVKRMTPAVSLGSVDTLIQHPAGLTHRVLDESTRQSAGIREGLMRLSVGIEDVSDLIADLEQAFANAAPRAVA
jgi:methionine-gamma-lyase